MTFIITMLNLSTCYCLWYPTCFIVLFAINLIQLQLFSTHVFSMLIGYWWPLNNCFEKRHTQKYSELKILYIFPRLLPVSCWGTLIFIVPWKVHTVRLEYRTKLAWRKEKSSFFFCCGKNLTCRFQTKIILKTYEIFFALNCKNIKTYLIDSVFNTQRYKVHSRELIPFHDILYLCFRSLMSHVIYQVTHTI